jgi:NAD(P)H-dependent FMN reductase
MKIVIVSGSHRGNSESGRVCAFIKERLAALGIDDDAKVVDLGRLQLPDWDEAVWSENAAQWRAPWQPIYDILESSDAIIPVTPEWSGMVPPRLKNLFLVISSIGKALAHKPGYIVSVSAGINGAYPVIELRSSSYKNLNLCYIPEHLIVRNVKNVFGAGEPSTEEDKYLRSRLDYGLKLLGQYASALKSVRSSGVIDHKTFPNGM